MENRFGIKDFFVFIGLAIVALLVILAMVQFDRQFDEIKALKTQNVGLTNDLAQIRRQLNDLANREPQVVVTPATVPTTGPTQGTQAAGAVGPLNRGKVEAFAAIKEAEQKPDFARGDWFVDNFGTNIGKITPLVSTDVYGAIVQAKVQEALVLRDPMTLEYAGLLATSWELSPDGKTIAFNLRKGVTFSDGEPFTSADVKFTFDWIMNEAVDAPRSRSYLKHLDSITVEGDYRVVFKFKEFIFNTFESVAGTGIMPKHFYEKYKPDEFNSNPGLLMGTGPYRMATPDGWRPGQRVELVRNERYWGTPPAFEKLVYYEVQEDVAEETMYRNRELDRFGPTPEQFHKLKDDPAIADPKRSSTWQIYSPISGYNYIGWNQRRAGQPTHYADKRVRQALTMLVDRQRLADELFFGYARPASGPFGYGTPQNDPNVKPLPYDPEKAKALLAEVGYKDANNDGILEGPDGQPFVIKLSYGSGNAFGERIVLFMKDSFARAGIKLEPDAVDWPVLLKRLDQRDFDACMLGWTTSIETDCNQIFHSSQTRDNGDNVISYVNPELDKAIDAARATVDDAERMKKWQSVHRIVAEDQPYTFLLNRQGLSFIDARIKNIAPSKMGLNFVNTDVSPMPWYVPLDQQLHKTTP
ncbi:MAG: peptide-binding protein [Tepidisphaeraceae bacterium]